MLPKRGLRKHDTLVAAFHTKRALQPKSQDPLIELIDSTNYTIGDNSGYSFYQVINGICYVDLLLTCVTPINGNTSAPGHLSLPKARSSFHATLIGANGTTDNIVQYVGASGVSFFKYGTAGKLYVGHFSYPVAES